MGSAESAAKAGEVCLVCLRVSRSPRKSRYGSGPRLNDHVSSGGCLADGVHNENLLAWLIELGQLWSRVPLRALDLYAKQKCTGIRYRIATNQAPILFNGRATGSDGRRSSARYGVRIGSNLESSVARPTGCALGVVATFTQRVGLITAHCQL